MWHVVIYYIIYNTIKILIFKIKVKVKVKVKVTSTVPGIPGKWLGTFFYFNTLSVAHADKRPRRSGSWK